MVTSCYITPQLHRVRNFAAYVARVSINHNINAEVDCKGASLTGVISEVSE